MWIQRTEEYAHLESIKMRDMTEPVSFNENDNAQTTDHNAEILIDAGVAVERSSDETESDEDEGNSDGFTPGFESETAAGDEDVDTE